MLQRLHGIVFSSDPGATRRFLNDVLRLPSIDAGEGWLIFSLPGAEVGVHPVPVDGQPPAGTHSLAISCDDLRTMVAELGSRGVEFDHPISEQSWGLETVMRVPGDIVIQLFEPRFGGPEPLPTRAKVPRASRSPGRRRPAPRGSGSHRSAPRRRRRSPRK
jgi:hypothetical protein